MHFKEFLEIRLLKNEKFDYFFQIITKNTAITHIIVYIFFYDVITIFYYNY